MREYIFFIKFGGEMLWSLQTWNVLEVGTGDGVDVWSWLYEVDEYDYALMGDSDWKGRWLCGTIHNGWGSHWSDYKETYTSGK